MFFPEFPKNWAYLWHNRFDFIYCNLISSQLMKNLIIFRASEFSDLTDIFFLIFFFVNWGLELR